MKRFFKLNSIMFSKYYHLISFILIVASHFGQNIEIKAKINQDLIKHDEDSFIVDIESIIRKNDFELVCACMSCSDLKFSFQNHLHNSSSQVK